MASKMVHAWAFLLLPARFSPTELSDWILYCIFLALFQVGNANLGQELVRLAKEERDARMSLLTHVKAMHMVLRAKSKSQVDTVNKIAESELGCHFEGYFALD